MEIGLLFPLRLLQAELLKEILLQLNETNVLFFNRIGLGLIILPRLLTLPRNAFDLGVNLNLNLLGLFSLEPLDLLDVTTLMDKKKAYIDGLEDSSEGGDALTFKFLYDPKLFKFLQEISTYYNDTANALSLAEKKVYFRITFPSHTTQTGKPIANGDICAKFTGEMSLSMDSVAVNSPMTFTMSVSLKSGIEFDTVVDDNNEQGYPLYW